MKSDFARNDAKQCYLCMHYSTTYYYTAHIIGVNHRIKLPHHTIQKHIKFKLYNWTEENLLG